MSILVLGASGYIGSAFFNEIVARGLSAHFVSRKHVDYTHEGTLRELLVDFLADDGRAFVINCAAFVPQPSVDLCKDHVVETLNTNVVFPVLLSDLCEEFDIALGHISTGCLYDDAKEYSEDDPPTRDFKGYCGFYLKTKFMAEQPISKNKKAYIWRIRLPFDEFDNPRNYLTKLRSYSEVWEHTNSLTHRGDFVKSALDMIQRDDVPFGVYNMVNSGSIAAREIIHMMRLKWPAPRFVEGPVTGSTLSTAKLEATGCGMRPVQDAVKEAFEKWKTE